MNVKAQDLQFENRSSLSCQLSLGTWPVYFLFLRRDKRHARGIDSSTSDIFNEKTARGWYRPSLNGLDLIFQPCNPVAMKLQVALRASSTRFVLFTSIQISSIWPLNRDHIFISQRRKTMIPMGPQIKDERSIMPRAAKAQGAVYPRLCRSWMDMKPRSPSSYDMIFSWTFGLIESTQFRFVQRVVMVHCNSNMFI